MSNDDLIPEDLRNLRRVRRGASPDIPFPNIPSVKQTNNTNTTIPTDQTPDQSCDIKDIETGIIVPYRAPPGITPPGGTPFDAILSELREISKSLHSHERLFEEIRNYLTYKTPTDNWLEVQRTTTVATPGVLGAISQDTVTNGLGTTIGYDTIDVFNSLQGRNAQRVWMVNDGVSGGTGDNLYLRTSPDGQNYSPEFLMLLGEIRIVNDVYEIRFRSPTINVTLRASEREIYPPYVTQVENTFTATGTSNRSNFTARREAVGIADSTLPNITIPDGFAVSIVANVNNAGQIFLSRTDATVATDRTTLAAGDVRSLFITNTNLIHVAGSVAGQFVDIVAEQT
jgi:hypothetical protein